MANFTKERSLADQVEALTTSQNKCGSGAGCLYKEALIDSLTEERDAALKLAADRLVDAERYRWLKTKAKSVTWQYTVPVNATPPMICIITQGRVNAEYMDSNIDAAMQAAKEAQ